MITRLLIVINVLAFVWEFITLGPGILSGNVDLTGLVRDGAIWPIAVSQGHEYWRLVSGAFLHGSILHIGVNMLSLWVLGNFIEAALGHVRMAIVYTVSMIVSSLGVVYFSGPNDVTLGASGAIFGLFGALFAIGFKFGPRGMELVKQNIGILIINLVITFAIPGISKAAHVAGLLSGFALTYLIYFPPRALRARVLDRHTGQEMESELETPYSSGLE
jgi:membrane associated rhomboid family serine protease